MKYFIAALKKYTVFSGRATRSEYWYFVLFVVLFQVVIEIIAGIAVNFNHVDAGSSAIVSESPIKTTIILVYQLSLFLPSLSLSVRRLHDTNRSGWMHLVAFIPVIGAIWLIVLFCTKGTLGENRYGPDAQIN